MNLSHNHYYDWNMDALHRTAQSICRRQSSPFTFLAFSNAAYAKDGIATHDQAWRHLQGSYDRLPVDAYLPANASYRRRRFGRFLYQGATQSLTSLPHEAFWQAKEHNSVAGGIQRLFAALEREITNSPLLHTLILFYLRQIQATPQHADDWKIYVHQIRVIAEPEQPGQPTPEGIHQDGHAYVAQVLVNRVNARGAQSRIYDLDKSLMAETTLTNPLDSLLVDDKRAYHEVTGLHAADPTQATYRDMLLIDFNPL